MTATTSHPCRPPPPPDVLRVGATLQLGPDASPQFLYPILLRVSRWWESGWDGWVWIAGDQLGQRGEPIEHREVFVRRDGLLPGTAASYQR